MSRNPHMHFYLSKKRQITLFDRIIIVAAILYPLSTLPQVVLVYQGNIEGVSVWSWIGYTFFAALFLIYGIIHKVKPMIIGNGLWFVVDVMVLFGLLINS